MTRLEIGVAASPESWRTASELLHSDTSLVPVSALIGLVAAMGRSYTIDFQLKHQDQNLAPFANAFSPVIVQAMDGIRARGTTQDMIDLSHTINSGAGYRGTPLVNYADTCAQYAVAMAVGQRDFTHLSQAQDVLDEHQTSLMYQQPWSEIDIALKQLNPSPDKPQEKEIIELARARHACLQTESFGQGVSELLRLGRPDLARAYHTMHEKRGSLPRDHALLAYHIREALGEGYRSLEDVAKSTIISYLLRDPLTDFRKLQQTMELGSVTADEIYRLAEGSTLDPAYLTTVAAAAGVETEKLAVLIRRAELGSDKKIAYLLERVALCDCAFETISSETSLEEKTRIYGKIKLARDELARAYLSRKKYLEAVDVLWPIHPNEEYNKQVPDQSLARDLFLEHMGDIALNKNISGKSDWSDTAVRIGLTEETADYLISQHDLQNAAVICRKSHDMGMLVRLVRSAPDFLAYLPTKVLADYHTQLLSDPKSSEINDVVMAVISALKTRYEQEGQFDEASILASQAGNSDLSYLYTEVVRVLNRL